VADAEDLKNARNDAMESLLKHIVAVNEKGLSTFSVTAARDLALAYRYIQGGTQPGSSVVESR
jgi:hypothetical protein